jgi:hypothetical protein
LFDGLFLLVQKSDSSSLSLGQSLNTIVCFAHSEPSVRITVLGLSEKWFLTLQNGSGDCPLDVSSDSQIPAVALTSVSTELPVIQSTLNYDLRHLPSHRTINSEGLEPSLICQCAVAGDWEVWPGGDGSELSRR